jgi:hypothetical protein
METKIQVWIPVGCRGENSLQKRAPGENIMASSSINIFHETKLKSFSYNMVLNYDAIGNIPWT